MDQSHYNASQTALMLRPYFLNPYCMSIYTGYCWNDIKDLDFIKYLDVVVDGPYIEELRDISLKWRGSSNQRCIDVKKSLMTGQVVLWCD